MKESREIIIFDTTLRDGEQAPGCSMTMGEKLKIAHALKELNVDVIEAGFAAASPGDFDAVNAIASEIDGPTIIGIDTSRRLPTISLVVILCLFIKTFPKWFILKSWVHSKGRIDDSIIKKYSKG